MIRLHPPPFLRWCLVAFGWTLLGSGLVACSDVQDEADEAATLTLVGRGSHYLAYQDGLGAWQPLGTQEGSAPQKLALTDPGGRYGVMNLCLDEATGNLTVNVQQGVLAQTPVVRADCLVGMGAAETAPLSTGVVEAEPPSAPVSVSGRLRGLAEGEYGNVYLGDASALVDSSVPEYRLELPEARRDLIATKYEQDARVPSRLVFKPGLMVAEGAVADADFNGPYAFRPAVAVLPLAGVRPGELLSGSVEVVTPTGTAALLGEYLGSDALAYALIPERLRRGAALRAEAQSFSYDDRTKAGSSRSVTRTFAEGMTPRLTLPQPFAEPELRLHAGEAGVRPQASWRAHPVGAGTYTQFYSQVQGRRSVSYRLSQSSAWFAGRPLSYTLPDFSALPEWEEAWGLVVGEPVFWDVSFSRRTESGAVFASRSGVLTP